MVALPTAELATAMPKSGGGYYFISRGMGSLFGGIVGISLWLGLVFATAFYLVGFGEYALAVLVKIGVPQPPDLGPIRLVAVLGVLCGIALTGQSGGGTENTTKLQNAIVNLLLGILAVFLTVGIVDTDLVVVGEKEPSVVDIIFGDAADRIADIF